MWVKISLMALHLATPVSIASFSDILWHTDVSTVLRPAEVLHSGMVSCNRRLYIIRWSICSSSSAGSSFLPSFRFIASRASFRMMTLFLAATMTAVASLPSFRCPFPALFLWPGPCHFPHLPFSRLAQPAGFGPTSQPRSWPHLTCNYAWAKIKVAQVANEPPENSICRAWHQRFSPAPRLSTCPRLRFSGPFFSATSLGWPKAYWTTVGGIDWLDDAG